MRRFAQAMLARGEDAARVQVRADLWSGLLTEEAVRGRMAEVTQRPRVLVRSWIEEAVASGELAEIPANALASILLALADGLMLHRALDPGAFQWRNISRAIDVLLAYAHVGVERVGDRVPRDVLPAHPGLQVADLLLRRARA
ncbi:MAG: TetR family transcriptional regulator C-terminal domain-containing protein [Solirubrobacteraceae bacterium]